MLEVERDGVVVEHARLRGMHRERAPLGGEDDPSLRLEPDHRLLAEAVANEVEAPFLAIPQGEREHAVEALHAGGSPLLVGAQHDLGVRLGAEAMAELLELFAKLEVSRRTEAIQKARELGMIP